MYFAINDILTMTWARDVAIQLRTKICLNISTGLGVCQAAFALFSDRGFGHVRKGQSFDQLGTTEQEEVVLSSLEGSAQIQGRVMIIW